MLHIWKSWKTEGGVIKRRCSVCKRKEKKIEGRWQMEKASAKTRLSPRLQRFICL